MTPSITQQFKAQLANEWEVGSYRGFPLKLRRMRAKVLYERGEMPLFFADQYRKAVGVEMADPNNEDPARKLTAKEHEEFARFQVSVVLDSCVEPRLKLKHDDPGDILLSDVPDDVQEFIYMYAIHLAHFPNKPEAEEGVTAESLGRFLHDRNRSSTSGHARKRRATVRSKTKRNVRR